MIWAAFLNEAKEAFTTLGSAVGLFAGAWRVRDEWLARKKKKSDRLSVRATPSRVRRNGPEGVLDMTFAYVDDNLHEGTDFTITAMQPDDLSFATWSNGMQIERGRYEFANNFIEVCAKSIRVPARVNEDEANCSIFAYAPSAPESMRVQVEVYSRARDKRIMTRKLWISSGK